MFGSPRCLQCCHSTCSRSLVFALYKGKQRFFRTRIHIHNLFHKSCAKFAVSVAKNVQQEIHHILASTLHIASGSVIGIPHSVLKAVRRAEESRAPPYKRQALVRRGSAYQIHCRSCTLSDPLLAADWRECYNSHWHEIQSEWQMWWLIGLDDWFSPYSSSITPSVPPSLTAFEVLIRCW